MSKNNNLLIYDASRSIKINKHDKKDLTKKDSGIIMLA